MGLSSFIIWRQLFNTKKCLGEESVKLFCNVCVWCKQAWVLFSHINSRPNFSIWISIKAMQNIHTKTIFTQKNALICAWKLNCGGADFSLLWYIVKYAPIFYNEAMKYCLCKIKMQIWRSYFKSKSEFCFMCSHGACS